MAPAIEHPDWIYLIIAIRIAWSKTLRRIVGTPARVVRTAVLPFDTHATTVISLNVSPGAAVGMIRTIPCLGVDQPRHASFLCCQLTPTLRTQRAADDHELSEVVGVVVGSEEDLAEDRLTVAVRDLRVEID